MAAEDHESMDRLSIPEQVDIYRNLTMEIIERLEWVFELSQRLAQAPLTQVELVKVVQSDVALHDKLVEIEMLTDDQD